MNPAAVTTVTVYAQLQTTYIQKPTAVQGGFCATITMDGPDLPRAEQGGCGTILIVAGAPSLKVLGVGAGVVGLFLHLALGRMFHGA